MDADPHHARDHASWSASSTAANWTCSGRIAMLTMAGPEKESEHAARGTAAHECAEKCLRSGADAISLLGTVVKTKEHEITIDEELTASAQMHIDYVRGRPFTSFLIEKKLSLDAIDPPFDAGGTCDVIGFMPEMIEVVDLKNGMTVVNVNENKQTRTYALCALLDLPAETVATIQKIMVTIVQPRAPHRDGQIRSETFHIADLVDWCADLSARMERSKRALDAFNALGGDRAAFDAWSQEWLATGNCDFCPAAAYCPKIKAEALALAGRQAAQWFETVEETPITLPDPKLLTPAELARLLDGFDMLTGWVSAVRAYAHGLAERGTEVPGYQLAEKIGFRTWLESDQAKLAEELGAALQLEPEAIHEPSKVKSVAQIEKTLGSKRKSELAALEGVLWGRPVKGTNLVASSRTTRPPALSKPETFFEQM